MTFRQLQQDLQQQPTLDACAAFLSNHAQALRTLFYSGISDAPPGAPLQADEREFEAEQVQTSDRDEAAQALIDFLNSPCGDQLRSGVNPPPAVSALLIYFISLCEHAGFHHLIERIAQVLPPGSLRSRAEAIFQYKYIPLASVYYTARFDNITATLHSAWDGAPLSQKAQCEDLAIEYFCSAAAPQDGIGESNRTTLQTRFADQHNQARFPLLKSVRVVSILNIPAERLPQEREDANARIAEAFYDEASLLLPVPPQPHHAAICATGGHCHPGLHPAREALAAKYPTEFANTNIFVKQPLTAATYTEFNDTTKCMRYFRQYMPLHMPQIERAVCDTLDQRGFTRHRVHIIDIGGGPGTLYAVLASLLHRRLYQDYHFDITLVEPAKGFHDFMRVIGQHVQHPNLNIREMYACTSDQLPTVMRKHDADWYFLGNAITPIVKDAGDAVKAVKRLCTVIDATRRKTSACVLTLAENTNPSFAIRGPNRLFSMV